jgi:hypothetical protein
MEEFFGGVLDLHLGLDLPHNLHLLLLVYTLVCSGLWDTWRRTYKLSVSITTSSKKEKSLFTTSERDNRVRSVCVV